MSEVGRILSQRLYSVHERGGARPPLSACTSLPSSVCARARALSVKDAAAGFRRGFAARVRVSAQFLCVVVFSSLDSE